MKDKNQERGDARQPDGTEAVVGYVRDFYEAKAREGDEEAAARKRKGSAGRVARIGVGLLCAAAWIAPSWMVFESAPPDEQQLTDGAKVTVYLASLQLLDYRDSVGVLPVSLDQAGVDEEDLSYSRLADTTFELSLPLAAGELRYHSSTPASQFLGSADSILQVIR